MTRSIASIRLLTLRRCIGLLSCCVGSIAVAEEAVNFNRDIRPLLSDRCFFCHGPDPGHRQGDLRLDVEQAAHARAIVAGDARESPLIERITSADPDRRMPPPESGKSLSDDEIALLKQWIADGGRYESHWSFTSPARPDVPRFTNADDADWVNNPIDAFILARLKSLGMTPSPAADRATLLRRVTLDLTGLPPTPVEVEAFLADESPDAYERVVDRLLASPRYGERMAQVWLDAARYADTMGYQADWERYQWRWRTWVIDAYNNNLPFDQFTIDQLAGDLLPNVTIEQIIATGFNRNHRINDEGGIIPEEYLVEYIVDRVDTTSATWMGLTMGCARCHDHKFDPISQADFYRMYAFFNAVPEKGKEGRLGFADPYKRVTVRGKHDEYLAVQQKVAEATATLAQASQNLGDEQLVWEQQELERIASIESTSQVVAAEKAKTEWQQILQLPPDKRSAKQRKQLAEHFATLAPSTAEERKSLADAREALADFEKEFTTYVMVMSDMAKPRPTYVLERGAYNKPGQQVEAAVPSEILGPLPDGAPANRLGLARWLVSGDHPLTSRVAVNRHWNMLFGRGLVETIEDFGLQGSYPSHPELLDWLATEYPRVGWDTKALLKLIVTSNTYGRSSVVSPDAREVDPHNVWLARMSRVRLPAEMIRDQALFASGLLVERIGGPSVKPYQPAGLWEELSFQDKRRSTDFYVQGTGDDLYRRGIYTFWKRSVPPPTMETFDAPTRDACTLNRSRTNTPLQALALMNDVTFVEASRKLAERALATGGNVRGQLDFVYRSLLARSPNERELQLLTGGYEKRLAFYVDHPDDAERLIAAGESPVADSVESAQLAALTTCVMNIMNLDETITRE